MRLVACDLEATGSDIRGKDRAVDLALVECPSFRSWQSHFSPAGKKVVWAAQKLHGLGNRFLHGKPLIQSRFPQILAFIGDAPLIAANARFDAELLAMEMWRFGIEDVEIPCHDILPILRFCLSEAVETLSEASEILGLPAPENLRGALADARLVASMLARITYLYPGRLEESLERTAVIMVSSDYGERLSRMPYDRDRIPIRRFSRKTTEPRDITLLIADINRMALPVNEAASLALGDPQDAWSVMDIREVMNRLAPLHAETRVRRALSGRALGERQRAVRWMCRGLDPERAAELAALRQAVMAI